MRQKNKDRALLLLGCTMVAVPLALTACMPEGGNKDIGATRVEVIQDKARGVVCYRTQSGRGIAISCLYDPLNPVTVEQK